MAVPGNLRDEDGHVLAPSTIANRILVTDTNGLVGSANSNTNLQNLLDNALQVKVVIQNGEYGYIGANDTFIPFKSQSDVDAAVRAAMVGNATAADVLNGRTFTNSSESGLVGNIPVVSGGTYINSAHRDTTNGAWIYIPYGYYDKAYNNTEQWLKLTDANCVDLANKQEKSVSSSASAQTVTPDSGKLLSKVTVNAISPIRSASAQAPGNKCWTYNNSVYFGVDYGWYPSGSSYGSMSNTCERYVSYANVASAIGVTASTVRPGQTILGIAGTKEKDTYTCGSNTGAATSNDMGDTNSYRYVNATAVYNKGVSDGYTSTRTQMGIVNRSDSGVISATYTIPSSARDAFAVVSFNAPHSNYSVAYLTASDYLVKMWDLKCDTDNSEGFFYTAIFRCDQSRFGKSTTYKANCGGCFRARMLIWYVK